MKNKKVFILILALCLGSCLLLISTISLSKYYSNRPFISTVGSDKFYFTVDLLGDTNLGDDLSKTYDLYGGDSKNISFFVRNYFDSLRITGSNVSYTVSLDGSAKTSASLNISSGSLTGSTLDQDEIKLSITEEYSNLDTVEVVVTSTSPYVKTMRVIFVLHKYAEVVECHLNDSSGSMIAELSIKANVLVKAKSMTIDFSTINSSSNALKIDSTNAYLLDSENTNDPGTGWLKLVVLTLDIDAGESLTINFFKEDISKNYSTLTLELTSTVVMGNVQYLLTMTEGSGE